uniref:Uncharacterized protein n=1 Tax=Anopheles farauti TaxID=69004 RepID=A0A182QGE2_9DIPT
MAHRAELLVRFVRLIHQAVGVVERWCLQDALQHRHVLHTGRAVMVERFAATTAAAFVQRRVFEGRTGAGAGRGATADAATGGRFRVEQQVMVLVVLQLRWPPDWEPVEEAAEEAAAVEEEDDAEEPTERMTGVMVSPFWARCCAVPPIRSSSADEPDDARCRMIGHAPERVAARSGADADAADEMPPWWRYSDDEEEEDDDDEDVSADSVLETEPIGLLAISTSTWLPSQLHVDEADGLFASSTAPWSSSADHICWRSSSLCSVRNTTSFSVCSVLSVRRSGIVRSSSCMNSGLSGRFCVITDCRHAFSFVYMRSISSTFRRPGRSGVISTIAQNSPISASVRCIEFMRSAKLNVESTRKRAFAPFWIVSRRITCPFRQMIELIDVSNMQISRTNSASNRPAFSSVNLSSCVSSWNPGIMPAKSITPRMTCANRWLNSCSDWSSARAVAGSLTHGGDLFARKLARFDVRLEDAREESGLIVQLGREGPLVAAVLRALLHRGHKKKHEKETKPSLRFVKLEKIVAPKPCAAQLMVLWAAASSRSPGEKGAFEEKRPLLRTVQKRSYLQRIREGAALFASEL